MSIRAAKRETRNEASADPIDRSIDGWEILSYYVPYMAPGCIENDFTVNGPLNDYRFAGDYPVSRYGSSLKISTWNGCTLVCAALQHRISIRRGCSRERSYPPSVCVNISRKQPGKNDLAYALFRTCNFHAVARVSQVHATGSGEENLPEKIVHAPVKRKQMDRLVSKVSPFNED